MEGLAAGPSLEGRTGIRGELIELNSDVWDVQAYYICSSSRTGNLALSSASNCICGGVMAQEHMLNRVREKFVGLMNDYLPTPDVKEYINASCC